MQDTPKAAPQTPYRLGPPTPLFNLGPPSPEYSVVAASVAPPPPIAAPRTRMSVRLRRALLAMAWIAIGAASARLLFPAAEPPPGAIAQSPPPVALTDGGRGNRADQVAASAEPPAAPAVEPTPAPPVMPAERDGEVITAAILAALDRHGEQPVTEEVEAEPLPLPLPVPVPVESVEELAAPGFEAHAQSTDDSATEPFEELVDAVLAARVDAAAADQTEREHQAVHAAVLAALAPDPEGWFTRPHPAEAQAETVPVPAPDAADDALAAPGAATDTEIASSAGGSDHEAILAAFLDAAEQAAGSTQAEPSAGVAETTLEIAPQPEAETEPSAESVTAAILAALAPSDIDAIATPSIPPAEPMMPPVSSIETPAKLDLEADATAATEHAANDLPYEAIIEAILQTTAPAAGSTPTALVAQATTPTPDTPPPASAAPTPAPPPVVMPAPAAPISAEIAAQAARNFLRGDEYLQTGDIAAARLFFERAARAGNMQAMTALARTYDPDALRQRGVVGLTPDPARAQFWYGKAAEAARAAAGAPLKQP